MAVKGEFQAYMRRMSGEEEGTKDETGAQWLRQGERENTTSEKYWELVQQIPLVLFAISVWTGGGGLWDGFGRAL